MNHFNEHALELAIMELFRAEGYTYTNGETVYKELTLLRSLQSLLLTKLSNA